MLRASIAHVGFFDEKENPTMSKKTLFALLLLGAMAFVILNPTSAKQATALFSSTVVARLSSVTSNTISTTSEHSIMGPPTVTAAFIDEVLAVAHSPAQGIGNEMYRLGVKQGIDPAIPLAFFHHESSFGALGVATTTQGIGNVRCSAGYACYAGYRSYPSWAASVADWYALMQSVYVGHGLTTVEKIIPVYAPSADNNNESAYITSVTDDLARWKQGQV